MGFVLPRATTTKSGADVVRQVIPADVREEYQRLYGKAWEERWRAEPGTPPAERKRQGAEWLAEISRRIATIRAAKRGEGIALSRKDAFALAGERYRWFVERRESEPGAPKRWELELEDVFDALIMRAPKDIREHVASDLEWTRGYPQVRAAVLPMISDAGQTAQFLASRGITLTNGAKALFLDCVLDKYVEALVLLKRRAQGDYTPDEKPITLPKLALVARDSGGAIAAPWKLFEGYVRERRPAKSTVNRWRVVFQDLEAMFGGPDAQLLTLEAAQAWADCLSAPKRSPITVRDIWVSAASTVYAWAKLKRLVGSNPFADVHVTVPPKISNRENPAFTSDEV